MLLLLPRPHSRQERVHHDHPRLCRQRPRPLGHDSGRHPAIGAKGTSSSNTWRKDDSGRATKIYRAMPTGEHDERAYFVGTVRTGQLLLLDLLPGSETLTWPLFGALHGHLSGMLLDTYSDAVLSLNLYPNRPIEG